MRTKVVAALVLVPLTALAITACGSAESGGDSAPAERITVTATPTPEPEPTELVAEDLIKEVSIDGMCGVY